MARGYTQTKRAEQAAETRQRIVEAAVELHGTVGPAATTTSMIAERAGVQRHTVYAHFPDETAMLMACSGHVFALDPLPDAPPPGPHRAAEMRIALEGLYGWYARNAQVTATVLRDAEHYAPVRAIAQLRFGPPMATYAALGQELTHDKAALWGLALSFHTWRTLVQDGGLDTTSAVEAMIAAIEAQPL